MDGFFILDQRKYAIVFEFGEAVRILDKPGLKLKVPFIDTVSFMEKRLSNIDSISKELTTADGKRILIDAFGKFKIKDPLIFYKKMNNKNTGERLLETAMRQIIGKIQLTDLFSSKRSSIMTQIKDLMNQDAPNFGIKITDVRIVHADFPEQNSISIYNRMETERLKESMQIRAEGHELAMEITSTTDKEFQILLSEAEKKSEIIKAEADKQAVIMLSEAYGKNYDFYSLYREVQGYYIMNLSRSKIFIAPSSTFLKNLGMEKNFK